MSPLLLGEAGDYLLRTEKFDQAASFYQRLLDDFPKSQMVDFAYNGLGEIAYQKKDYPESAALFHRRHGEDRCRPKAEGDLPSAAPRRLLALGKLDEAQKGL